MRHGKRQREPNQRQCQVEARIYDHVRMHHEWGTKEDGRAARCCDHLRAIHGSQKTAPATIAATAAVGCLRQERASATNNSGSRRVAPLWRNPAVMALTTNASGAQRSSPRHTRAASQPTALEANRSTA